MKAKNKSIMAWIGHRSWIKAPAGTIYKTKKAALDDWWPDPSRVRITVLDKRPLYRDTKPPKHRREKNP